MFRAYLPRWSFLTFGPKVPVVAVISAPSIMPIIEAAIDCFRERPNSGPSKPNGKTPTWMLSDHHMRKIFHTDGGRFSSSGIRSMPCVSTPSLRSSHDSKPFRYRKTAIRVCNSCTRSVVRTMVRPASTSDWTMPSGVGDPDSRSRFSMDMVTNWWPGRIKGRTSSQCK